MIALILILALDVEKQRYRVREAEIRRYRDAEKRRHRNFDLQRYRDMQRPRFQDIQNYRDRERERPKNGGDTAIPRYRDIELPR